MSGDREVDRRIDGTRALGDREPDAIDPAMRNEYGGPVFLRRAPGRSPAVMRRAQLATPAPRAEGRGATEVERLLADPTPPEIDALAETLARCPREDHPIRAAIERTLGTDACVAVIRRASAIRIAGVAERPAAVEAAGTATDGIGAPTELPYRGEMEAAFGQSFAGVQAYCGPKAHAAAAALGADAYTTGDRIVFGTANPAKDLVAHELTHVVQQRGARAPIAARSSVSQPGDDVEVEADRVAAIVSAGGQAPPIGLRDGGATLHRRAAGATAARGTGAGAGNAPTATPRFTSRDAHMLLLTARVYATMSPPEVAKAIAILQQVEDWLTEVGSSGEQHEHFHGKGISYTTVQLFAGKAEGAVRGLRRKLKLHGAKLAHGNWDDAINTLVAAKKYLQILNDESRYEDDRDLQAIDDLALTSALVGSAIYFTAVGATAGLIVAVVAEASIIGGAASAGGTAVLNLALANPIVATEVALFATGTVFQIANAGGIKEYLDQVSTKEGAAQMAFELLVLRYSIAPPGKSEQKYRLEAQVEAVTPEQFRLRTTKAEPEFPDTPGTDSEGPSLFRGLGDASSSPWLKDKRAGVPSHLEHFRDGASYLVPHGSYETWVKGQPSVGRKDGLYVTTRAAMDQLLADAAGDISYINQKLGIKPPWKGKVYRVDVHNPLLHNARMPSGMETSANPLFRYGGYTHGGMPEVVLDPVPSVSISTSVKEVLP